MVRILTARRERFARMRSEVAAMKPSLLEEGERRCFVCHFGYVPVLAIHHVVPLAEGGRNQIDNLVALCPTCHALVHKALSMIGRYTGQDIEPESMADYRAYVVWSDAAIMAGQWSDENGQRLWWLARRGKGMESA